MARDRTNFARRLFAGIAPDYERMGALLSIGQDGQMETFPGCEDERSSGIEGARCRGRHAARLP